MTTRHSEVQLLFETSWEVCNKVGGIYTVLSTKAKNLQKIYKDKVIFIGPDIHSGDTSHSDFTELKTLFKTWKNDVELPFGIKTRIGRWEVPGRPIAILVSFEGLYADKDNFYGEMWHRFGVDSLHAYGDYDEACAFARAAGIVIDSLSSHLMGDDRAGVIAHFDEWTTGMGLLYVKAHARSIATVFTTHATSIGRSICGNGKDLYKYFKGYNGDQMSRELNMESKHSLEKAAALNADCFTTVSEITADECEQLLGRRPDVVTPNGFETSIVPKVKALASIRSESRKTLLAVARALTGKQYEEDTFIIATSGRFEYRNKGLDMFIDSVKKFGTHFQQKDQQAVAFLMVPAWSDGARKDLSHNMRLKRPRRLDYDFVTHNIVNFDEDMIVARLRDSHELNTIKQYVDIIYVPCYLDGHDGIFNKTYYELLAGIDVTVFASYYEPWGYTPLESIAFGVPTITTKYSGFGRWILSHFSDSLELTGVKVIEREDDHYEGTCEKIARTIEHVRSMSAEQIIELKHNAQATASKITWDTFVEYYEKAFDIAIQNASLRNEEHE
ncbi:MAG: glycogen/starch synthase [Muribaculaceae bacterium]|nr:glycogen/starch synthase [Muribaculaceae bacterium]